MNKQANTTYTRITELVSLLCDPMKDSTVANISKWTNTTPEQTRMDLLAMDRSGFSIDPQEVLHSMTWNSDRCDHTNLFINTALYDEFTIGSCLLFLTRPESDLFAHAEMTDLKIKDTPTSLSHTVTTHAIAIEEAIRLGCQVAFRYQDRFGDTTNVVASPRLLYHNSTDDLMYLLTFEEDYIGAYRLDRIRFSIRLLKNQPMSPIAPDDPRYTRLEKVWGSDITSTEDPVHVRVRIEHNTPNILNKIRSVVSERKLGTLQDHETYSIYEDDIIGISSFRSWLMTFGSSVFVEEPKNLADSLLESSRRRLANYEADDFI